MLPSFDPTELPALLAGPMLRRLTRRNVAVFAALQGDDATISENVTLEVKRGTTWGDAVPIARATATPLRIGVRLSVICLDAESPEGFLPGQDYLYRLSGAALDDLPEGDWAALAAKGRDSAGFVGLPAGEDGLRIVHTSCRKPHGGGRDAMALIAGLIDGPAEERPHLMVLSGDQIYADDVSPALFPQLRALARGLVGRDEGADFPTSSTATRGPKDSKTEILGPTGNVVEPMRPLSQSKAREPASHAAGLTSSHPGNQLWLFEDYVAHYLLAWSPACWSAPAFDTFPANDMPPVPDHHWRADPAAPLGETFLRDIAEHKRTIAGTVRAMPEIARALANVPSLMVFDDHEVTDDWNLHFDWIKEVYANPGDTVGRRIVANGLGAYLLFQHWGNRPEDMAAGRPARLAAEAFAHRATETETERAATEARLGLPDRDVLAGFDPTFTAGLNVAMSDLRGSSAPEPVDWSVRLFGDTATPVDTASGPVAIDNPCPIVLLDARMRRGFQDRGRDTWRVHPDDLAQMLPDPAPDDERTLIVVEPIPVFNLHLLEHVLQPTKVLFEGAEAGDNESWRGDALQDLIERLSRRPRVVLLGGDVHYGFTRWVEVTGGARAPSSPDDTDWRDRSATLVQFCASAAKNSDEQTRLLHDRAGLTQALDITRRRTFSVWGRDVSAIDPDTFLRPPPGAPSLPYDSIADIALGRTLRRAASRRIVLDAETAAAYGITEPPLYSYRAELIDDERRDAIRLGAHETALGLPNTPRPAPWGGEWNVANSVTVVADLMFHDVERTGRVVSGLPQVGVVVFTAGADGTRRVVQELHRAGGHPDRFEDPDGADALARAFMAEPVARLRTEVEMPGAPVS